MDPKYPPVLLQIDKDNKLTKVCDMPDHPVTGKKACPMGLDIGSDGNL